MDRTDFTITEIRTEAERRHAHAIREAVFVAEQGIARTLDRDGNDDRAHHVLAWQGAHAVGTGRLLAAPDGRGHLARIAVLPSSRGHRLGARIIARLEAIARREGCTALYLEAHQSLEYFYQKLGYQTQPGALFAGPYRLIRMEKTLGDADSPRA